MKTQFALHFLAYPTASPATTSKPWMSPGILCWIFDAKTAIQKMLGAAVNAGWNQLSESNKQGTKVMAEVKHWHFDSVQPTKTEAMEIPRSQHDVSMHDVGFRLWFSVLLCRLVGNLGTDMNNKTGSYNLLLGWQKGYPLLFAVSTLPSSNGRICKRNWLGGKMCSMISGVMAEPVWSNRSKICE